MKNQIVEIVPNFSTGKDKAVLEKIIEPFREAEQVKLLDYSQDSAHNRAVVTVAGEPKAVQGALLKASKIAIDLIDLRKHEGEHPRMGAIDVIPFIPIKNMSIEDCDLLAKETAKLLAEENNLPIYLYEASASKPHRRNLARVRKGEFEGLSEKMQSDLWQPDFGPNSPHESAGATAVGARLPLVAYNINLASSDLEVAVAIGKKVRHLGGGLRFVKAMGVSTEDPNVVQVSMNLTDYSRSALYQVFELVKLEAKRYGVQIKNSEIIGLIPAAALYESAAYYLQINDFKPEQVLENKLFE